MLDVLSRSTSSIFWKDFLFLKTASDQNYSGSSLTSIRLASMSLNNNKKICFLKSDKKLALQTDDDGNPLLLFHHFQSLPTLNLKQDQKFIPITGTDPIVTPVILNTLPIKNYSQTVPKWTSLQNVTRATEFQNYNAEIETTTISNAIILPLPLLVVFLTSINQSPATIALLLITKMMHLDAIKNKTERTSSPFHEHLQTFDDLLTASSNESYKDSCGYIIQWIYLTMLNWIKPIWYSLAHDQHTIKWFEASISKLTKNDTYQHKITKEIPWPPQNFELTPMLPSQLWAPIKINTLTETSNNFPYLP